MNIQINVNKDNYQDIMNYIILLSKDLVDFFDNNSTPENNYYDKQNVIDFQDALNIISINYKSNKY